MNVVRIHYLVKLRNGRQTCPCATKDINHEPVYKRPLQRQRRQDDPTAPLRDNFYTSDRVTVQQVLFKN